jgi:RNA polymerase sigma-70 factor (ECF subfamily)
LIEPTANNEKLLIEALVNGNEIVFRSIYDIYRNRIYSYALRLTNSKVLAEDILQEVFIKVWLNKEKLAEVNNFSAWLYAIARNSIFDALKVLAKEKLSQEILEKELIFESEIADAELLDAENDRLFKLAIEQLTPQQKEVFCLSRFEQLTQKEIAEKMGLSLNTVKSHMVSALKVIRFFFKNQDIPLALIIFMLSMKS